MNWLFRSGDKRDSTAAEIYADIVALARQPRLYADLGVPDTVAGRFEMVLLHVAAALRRLERGSEAERDLGQRVFDAFCDDMDASLREFGVGDAVMGKRMRKVGRSYFGRSQVYGEAFEAGDRAAMTSALGRNLFPGAGKDATDGLADYAFRLRDAFDAVGAGAFEEGGKAVPRDIGEGAGGDG